jgi:hypothetical protein
VVSAVAILTGRHPDAALAADSSGSVALHVACASTTPCEALVRLLLDSDCEAASIIDEVCVWSVVHHGVIADLLCWSGAA